MTVSAVLDAAGRRRSPATMPSYHAGRSPRNKGLRYPADPPTVEEIIAVMRQAADDRHGWRLRALVVVLWRGGLRVQEALALIERDLDERRGSVLVRNAKRGRRREIGMDAWAWEQLRPWLAARFELPVGPLFCTIDGPTRGRPWSSAGVRVELRRLAAEAGVRRRFAPHQLRHLIQRQLGHANLGTTSIYLQGIDTEEVIATVHARRAPMMSATAGLCLYSPRFSSRGPDRHGAVDVPRACAAAVLAIFLEGTAAKTDEMLAGGSHAGKPRRHVLPPSPVVGVVGRQRSGGVGRLDPRTGDRSCADVDRRLGAARPSRGGLWHALVACGLAAAAALYLAPTFLYYDAWYSLAWGRELAHGRMPEFDTFAASTPHPLAVAWAALVSAFGDGAAIASMQGIAWLSYGAAVVALFRVGRLAFGSVSAGVVGAAVAATSYALLRPASLAAIDVTFAALALWALALELQRPRRGVPVLALLGLAGLLRPEAWLLSGAYALWLLPPRSPRRRVTIAALAAAPPLLWGLTDLASTGNLLHSLQHTQEGTTLALRPTGLANVPATVSIGLRELVRAPVVFGGFAGVVLALRHRRSHAALPAAVLGLALGFFALLGVARLPLLDRFLILPAALLTVFFGYALTGWRGRRGWTVGAALLGLLALLFAPSQIDRLRQLRDGDDVRATAQRDMRALVRSARVRAALAHCDGLIAPVFGAQPELAFYIDRLSADIEVLQNPTPRGHLLLLPATIPVAESYGIGREVLDELRRRVLPRFRHLAGNRSWMLSTRNCRAP